MKQLLIMRGAPGAGKSTWVKNNDLEQYTLSPDDIRLLFQGPVMNEQGGTHISMKNDNKVWRFLFDLLEERMKRGEFTIIDATHSKSDMINRYKKLAKHYRYRVNVVDFSDVPLKILLKQNKERESHKFVPEAAIMNIHARMQTENVPSYAKVSQPDEVLSEIGFTPIDFSHYKKIHHIGDIHGCYDVLQQYLSKELREDELYIFLGDLVDRGIQNKEVLDFFLEIYERKNVIIIEGNHEIHLWRWANDYDGHSRTFNEKTQPELEAPFWKTLKTRRNVPRKDLIGRLFNKKEPILEEDDFLDERALGFYKKQVRQFYRRLYQAAYYTYHGKTVLVTHGGLSKAPNDLVYIATEQMVKGVGDYEIDIDEIWDNLTPDSIYQIHGHRNIYRLPTQASPSSFNLEGRVEHGGHLRVVTLSKEGFETHEIKNDVFEFVFQEAPKHLNEDILTIDDWVDYMENHDLIQAKEVMPNIKSYNFTRESFNKRTWDDLNMRARGLFINTETKEIVNRSYNKFFNINERPDTKIGRLPDTLSFPVKVYSKPNGYLGMLGYDSASDELIFSSKSEVNGPYAEWFKELFYKTFDEEKVSWIKRELKGSNITFVFEVILPEKDPHIIKYDEDHLVLLDLVERTIKYNKMDYSIVHNVAEQIGVACKEHCFTLDDWIAFYRWYRQQTEDFSIEEEGYVIEDAEGFMTKLKLPYYNFWKQMRGVAEKVGKKQDDAIKRGAFVTPLHNYFFAWMKTKDPKYIKKTMQGPGIIHLREEYYKEKGDS